MTSLTNAFELDNCYLALHKCRFSYSEIAILMLGEDLLLDPCNDLRSGTKRLLAELLLERDKEKEVIDPVDKKLHRIKVELLFLIVKKYLDDDLTKAVELVERKTYTII